MENLPPLRMAVLTALLELKDKVKADPEFLDTATLPYDAETVSVLKKILEAEVRTVTIDKTPPPVKGERGRPTKDVELSEADQLMIRDEIRTMIEDLKKLGSGEGLEISEQIAITRNKHNLLESALKMQERALNVKKMGEFQQTVMGILDDLISEEGREIYLRRIDAYR